MVILVVTLLLSGLAVGAEPAPTAQSSGTPAVAPPPAAPEIGTFHNPTEWLEMGGDFRFREHYGYNWTALNRHLEDPLGNDASQFHWQRIRSRLWMKFKLDEETSVNTRFTWEFRMFDNPEASDQHTDFDEIIIDNLNYTKKNFLDMPVTAILGRQDIMDLGKGWLVMDGTPAPYEGSRTYYFDAARFTYDLAEKTKLDLIYITQHPDSDWWLKPINDRERYVTFEEEEGLILYLTDKSRPTQLEGYFMVKNNNPVDALARNLTSTSSLQRYSKKAEIYTVGGAASAPIKDNWNYRVEGAVQLGDSASPNTFLTDNDDEESLRAFGAKCDLEYSFKDDLDSKLHVVYEFLSGDDPSSSRVESFNPLWAQWPQWSELYQPYVTSMEDGLVSNLHRIAFGHKFKPNNQWQILTDWHLLYADENTFRNDARFSQDGSFRGHLLTCWARYNFTKQLKGNLVFEYLWPGHYYGPGNRDSALYFHWTVEYLF
jgi:hypothetical protein